MNQLPHLTFDLWSVLLLLGCLHGCFLSLVLMVHRQRSRLILAALILVFSYSLWTAFLWQSELMIYLPHLVATSMPLLFLIGPLYYWFFRAILKKKQQLAWWHFAPAIICVFTILPFCLQPLESKINYILSRDVAVVDLPATRAIYFGLLLIQLALYWISVNRLKFPSSRTDGRKNLKSIPLGNWLKIFHYSFGVFMLIFLATYLLLTITPWNYGEIRYGAQLSLALMVHVIGYYTLKNSSTISYLKDSESYGLWDKRLKITIPETMEQDKPYLDPELTLARFSANLKVSPAAVSGIINQEFDCNFSDYINGYRVREALRLLQDPSFQHYKLEAIGLEAGFSNKVSFNRAFKKHTGTTPSLAKTGRTR